MLLSPATTSLEAGSGGNCGEVQNKLFLRQRGKSKKLVVDCRGSAPNPSYPNPILLYPNAFLTSGLRSRLCFLLYLMFVMDASAPDRVSLMSTD